MPGHSRGSSLTVRPSPSRRWSSSSVSSIGATGAVFELLAAIGVRRGSCSRSRAATWRSTASGGMSRSGRACGAQKGCGLVVGPLKSRYARRDLPIPLELADRLRELRTPGDSLVFTSEAEETVLDPDNLFDRVLRPRRRRPGPPRGRRHRRAGAPAARGGAGPDAHRRGRPRHGRREAGRLGQLAACSPTAGARWCRTSATGGRTSVSTPSSRWGSASRWPGWSPRSGRDGPERRRGTVPITGVTGGSRAWPRRTPRCSRSPRPTTRPATGCVAGPAWAPAPWATVTWWSPRCSHR